MSDRIAAFIVTLEKDIRDDDAEAQLNAIRCIRGVRSVQPVVADTTLHIAEERARYELGQKLLDVVYPNRGGR